MSKRILTVDDSRTMLDMLGFTLTKAGYEVLRAENGQQGLDVLETEKVNAIITDINMPVMDGISFTKAVRAKPEFRGVPILILTTESAPEKKAQGKEAGATGWIVKPFDPDRLVEVVRKVTP